MDPDTAIPVCYRHADRETRLGCTVCGRPICIACMTPAPVGQRCPECAAPAKGIRPAGRQERAPVSMVILGLAVGLFVLGTLVPAVGQQLFLTLAQHNLSVLAGDTYRLVGAGFLHAGLTHVLFNMWALGSFGPPLEREVGSVPYAGLYAAALLWGAVAYLWLGPATGVAVGASGAIFGLFGAWTAAAVRSRHTPVGRAQLRQMLMLLAINAALPIVVPQIAWQAHAGGFAAGFAVAALWGLLPARGAVTRWRAGIAWGVAALAWGAALAA